MEPASSKTKFPVVLLSLLVISTLIVGLSAQAVEIGKVTVDTEWKRVELSNAFRNPVVVAKPLSYNGGDPAVVRIQNVDSRSFQIRVQEWDYLDDTHTNERVSYMVMERGSHGLTTDMRVEAGITETDATGSFEQVRFSTSFRRTPVVISSVMSYQGSQAAVTRNQNVSRSGFEVMMQEQEANEPQHAEEKISYIAIEPGTGMFSGRRMKVDTVSPVDQNFRRIDVGFGDSITVKADEETSRDEEKNHAGESIGYLAIEGGPRYFLADMQTTNGSDVANLRYGGEVVPEEEQEKREQAQEQQEGEQAKAPSRAAPQGIIIEPPAEPGLNVSVSTDRYQYSIGSTLRIQVDVSQKAYLYVFDYDTEGQMRLVFPNRYSQQNLIGPGRYELPDGGYSFKVTGPPGVEFVQAVATTKKVGINKLLKNPNAPFARESYPPVVNPEKLNQEFKSRLEAKFSLQFGGDDSNVQFQISPVSWDSATTSFRVGAGAQPNQDPVARFSYNPSDPRQGERVTFSAQSSYDPDGSINRFTWDFNGDGRTDASGQRVSHRYSSSGQYNVRLTVEDNDGARSSTTKRINVSRENQAPSARFNYNPSQPEPGESVSFDGSNSSDPDGNIASYRWDFNGDGFTDAYGRRASHSFGSSGSFDATLTVVDNDGARSSTTQTIRVVEPQPRYDSSEADSFDSNGERRESWYWLRSFNHYGEWEWRRISATPREAYINLEFLVSNELNGGSGYSATVEIQILDQYGNVVESGTVSLENPFRPKFSGNSDGVGYKAFGAYEVRNPSQLRNGFRVRVDWPPTDNKNLFAVKRSAAILAYTT
ncbi:PKD domain-containing protein [Candidatus Bipolaricaulota bacterium]|nr:PKD domain-containing protein [Candidatus Bipolaricaulota bacterium]